MKIKYSFLSRLLLYFFALSFLSACQIKKDDALANTSRDAGGDSTNAGSDKVVFGIERFEPVFMQTEVPTNQIVKVVFNEIIEEVLLPEEVAYLEENFVVYKAVTGEIVPGTKVVGGIAISFGPSELFQEDTVYIVAIKWESADQTYFGDFSWAFSTGELPDSAAITHPSQGSLSKIVMGLAYDVDAGQSVSLADLRSLIMNASQLAVESNTFMYPPKMNHYDTPQWFTSFHFWPNIINLTEVYYRDAELAGIILDKIFHYDPERETFKPLVLAAMRTGERIYIARDFIDRVENGFSLFFEVNFALLINIDTNEIWELLAHPFEDEGLGALNDVLAGDLKKRFKESDQPKGTLWQLCLRGNLRPTEYSSFIIDKLGQSPGAQFWAERVNSRCFDTGNELPRDLIPLKLPETPPFKITGTLEPEPDIKALPANPHHPPIPTFDELVYQDVKPWPFAGPEIPADPEEPKEPAYPGPTTVTECGTDSTGMTAELAALEGALNQMIGNRLADRSSLSTSFDLQWPVSVTFFDPCIKELYESTNSQFNEIQLDLLSLESEESQLGEQLMTLIDSAEPMVKALISRTYWWRELFTVFRIMAQLEFACEDVIPPGGLDQLGQELIPPTPELLYRFQEDIAYALVYGYTWDEALYDAQRNARNFPSAADYLDSVYRRNWIDFAVCTRDKLVASIQEYLPLGNQSAEGLQAAIDVMLQGQQAFDEHKTTASSNSYADIKQVVAQQNEVSAEMYTSYYEIDKLRRLFVLDAYTVCLEPSFEHLLRLEAKVAVMDAYLNWCKDPPNATPDAWPDKGSLFCSALQQLEAYPTYQAYPTFMEYIAILISSNC